MPSRPPRNTATKAQRRRRAANLREPLDALLEAALFARVALFGLPSLPDKGFDSALRADWPYRAARTEFNVALSALVSACPVSVGKKHELAVEERANDLAVAAAMVGWRLGVAARGAAKDKR